MMMDFRRIMQCLIIPSSFTTMMVHMPITTMDEVIPSQHKQNSDVIWKIPTDEKVIALTFDDGPNPKYTPKILDLLKQYQSKATFFVIGEHVEKYPQLVRREVLEGHELGNHTFTHKYLKKPTMKQVQNEIVAAQNSIYSVTGVMPYLFRPPGGFLNDIVINISKKEGYKIVMWTWDEDSRDWSKPGIKKIVSKVLNNAHNGDIILFHDHTSGRSQTIGALKIIIPELKKRGFRFVTISDLINTTSMRSIPNESNKTELFVNPVHDKFLRV
jgi:polysaccharide deacetylase family sporulation protein PdaB